MSEETADIATSDDVDRELLLAENFNKIISEDSDALFSVIDDLDEYAGGADDESTADLERQAMEAMREAREDADVGAEESTIKEAMMSAGKRVLSAFTGPDGGDNGDPLGVFSGDNEEMRKRAHADEPYSMSTAWCGSERMIDDSSDTNQTGDE